MLKEGVTQDLVDALPIARDQALLIQVDKVALDLLIALIVIAHVALGATFQMVIDLAACCVFKRVTKGL